MGTNYYLHAGICKCCGRYDRIHICKSFATWHAPCVEQDEAPWDLEVQIATWAEWKDRLRTEAANGGRIFDEYGKEMPVHEFIQRGDEHGHDQERRHHLRAGPIKPRGEWYDADNYWFYAGEFS